MVQSSLFTRKSHTINESKNTHFVLQPNLYDDHWFVPSVVLDKSTCCKVFAEVPRMQFSCVFSWIGLGTVGHSLPSQTPFPHYTLLCAHVSGFLRGSDDAMWPPQLSEAQWETRPLLPHTLPAFLQMASFCFLKKFFPKWLFKVII